MSLRELMDKNKQITTAAGGVLLVAAIALIIYQLSPEKPSKYEWYSNDDGATWFRDSIRRAPPFDKDGKPAALVKVYECNGKKFVASMTRFKPEAQKKMAAFYEAEDHGQNPDPNSVIAYSNQVEYKRPGDKQWTSDMAAYTSMLLVKCPDGSAQEPTIVFP